MKFKREKITKENFHDVKQAFIHAHVHLSKIILANILFQAIT